MVKWMQTFTGRRVDVMCMQLHDVCIIDIAHALSHICRYNGHCDKFYSVAEHSVLVSQMVEDHRYKMHGLLHDAAEAYICDIIKTVKVRLGGYATIEHDIEDVIYRRFNVQCDHKIVKKADNIILATEAHQLMVHGVTGWGLEEKPVNLGKLGLPPEEAKSQFLRWFRDLGGTV